MKKKLICILLMVIGFIGVFCITVSADENILSDYEEDYTGFTNDDGEEGIMPMSSGADYSKEIDNPLEEFKEKYPAYSWSLVYEKSTKDISNDIPVNINNYPFSASTINKAIEQSETKSDYGGCGPIAMIGLLYYYAKSLGYSEIMEKPYNTDQQIQLAKDVFDNIHTSELPSTNSTDEIQTCSGGGKSTMTLPWDCVNGVNKVLNKYGLSNKFKVNYKGSTIIGGHKSEYLNIITSHIDQGIPVAVYTGIGTGDGDFSKHYFNAYKYEKYVGVDANKNTIEKYAIRACLNLQDTNDKSYYFDAELLDSAMCGVVYIDPVYSRNELLTASNFSSFVNENNQGQYFFEKKTAQIVTDSGYTFGTVRLRCGYIEDKYLVLSANRENAGTAYLEFHLDEEIKGFEFDASLWSLYEDLTEHDMFAIEYKDGQNWVSHVRFDIPSMSPIKINPKSYNVLFNKGVTSFRFYLRKNMPSGDRNKGRVVLNNIHLHFN